MVFFLWQHTKVSYYRGSKETSHYENICQSVTIKITTIKLQCILIHNLEVWLHYPQNFISYLWINQGKDFISLQCAINANSGGHKYQSHFKHLLFRNIVAKVIHKPLFSWMGTKCACIVLNGINIFKNQGHKYTSGSQLVGRQPLLCKSCSNTPATDSTLTRPNTCRSR